jgi:diaminopimelate epimerase
MSYRNADGSPADLCLNGTRCAARLAFELGWATDRVTVETGAGPLPARRLAASRIAIAAPPPASPPEPLRLEAEGELHEAWRVTVGVPHLVLLRPDLPDAPVDRLGRALRHHPALAPDGANVDFIRLPSRHHIDIRTYERGVEAETLACGTGALAAAAAALHAGLAALPLTLQTRGGFPLGVEGTVPSDWELTGDARLIARVDLLPEAADSPTPPDWR